jgi:hypothetical protein
MGLCRPFRRYFQFELLVLKGHIQQAPGAAAENAASFINYTLATFDCVKILHTRVILRNGSIRYFEGDGTL